MGGSPVREHLAESNPTSPLGTGGLVSHTSHHPSSPDPLTRDLDREDLWRLERLIPTFNNSRCLLVLHSVFDHHFESLLRDFGSILPPNLEPKSSQNQWAIQDASKIASCFGSLFAWIFGGFFGGFSTSTSTKNQ